MARTEKRALNIRAKLDQEILPELAKIRKEVEKTNKRVAKGNKAAESSFKAVRNAVIAVGSAMVALRGIDFIKNIAAQTDEIGKLAVATGQTTEAVSELQYAFKLAGGNTEQFRSVLSSLLSSQRGAINGSNEQVAAFEALGVSIGELRTLDPAQLLARLAEGLGNITDSTEQTLRLSSLFPEQWRNVLNLIQGGGDQFRSTLLEARKQGAVVSQEQAKAAADLNDAMERAQQAVNRVGRELLVTFGPTIVDALDTFADVLLGNQEAVRAIGQAILRIINVTLTGALQAISGLLQILEATGLSDATVGTAEQIAKARAEEARAAAAAENAYNAIADAQERGIQATRVQLDNLNELQVKALDAFEKAEALAQAPSVAIERLLLDLERATGEMGSGMVERAGGGVFRAIREGLRAAAGELETDAEAAGAAIGASVAAGMIPGISAGVDQALAAGPGGIKEKLERPFIDLNWEGIEAGYKQGLQGLRKQVNNFSETVGGLLADGVQRASDALANTFQAMIEGTKSAKEAWKDFGRAVLSIIAQILAKAIALKVTQTVLGLADGGVLPGVSDDNASLPVQNYARGGVARSPQLAVFGEGRQAEAFVPLPDNRSIPVTINGGGGVGGQQVNLNIYAWDSKDAARGLVENRQVLQQIFTAQADNMVGMRQTIQRAAR